MNDLRINVGWQDVAERQGAWINDLEAEIERLRDENNTLRADAERYRFIKEKGWGWLALWHKEDRLIQPLDQMIDKRRGEKP